MKKIKMILLSIICMFSILCPIQSVKADNVYINDQGKIFKDYQCNIIEKFAQNFENRYYVNVYFVTSDSTDENFDLKSYIEEKYQEVYQQESGVVLGVNKYIKNYYEDAYYNYAVSVFGNLKECIDPQFNIDYLSHNSSDACEYVLQNILYLVRNEIDKIQSQQVIDFAQILARGHIEKLTDRIEKLKERYQCDIVIVTTYSWNKKNLTSFADDYFDDNGYGIGDNYDGMLFLLDTYYSYYNYHISTSGKAIKAFTDWGIEYIGSQTFNLRYYRHHYQCLDMFLDYVDMFLSQYETDRAYDSDYHPGLKVDEDEEKQNDDEVGVKLGWPLSTRIFVAMFIGFIVGLIMAVAKLGKSKTVKKVTSAKQYVKEESLKITNSKDIFLYTTLTRSAKLKSQEKNTNTQKNKSKNAKTAKNTKTTKNTKVSKTKTSAKHTKGSSTHQSSSGRTHGGGGS